MLIAHKIALDLNNKQATYMARSAGCARFAYNWALAEWNRQYAAWKEDNGLPKPNPMALRRQLNAVKRDQFPWMLEVTKCAPQLAIMQLGVAFKNFFARRGKYPVFRRKGVHDRFSISNDQFSVEGCRIRIPNLGWVRMRESLRFQGKILSATVSRVADRWFVSLAVETEAHPHLPEAENQGVAGVDLGITALATLDTGEKKEGAKALKRLLRRLRFLSRRLSRKQKSGKNRNKVRQRLSRLHARIANVRSDGLHQLMTNLTRRFHTLGIEDLNVKGMMQNHRLARHIADMGFFEFRRQLDYKAAMRGGRIVVADRFFPSSKTCSACGHKFADLPLAVREWNCPECGTQHDRDQNAAINLKNYAVSSTVKACGEEGSGSASCPCGKTGTKPASVKQETNSKPASGQIRPDSGRFA